MWLLHTNTLELQEFINIIPPYAILSHTWGSDEISFKDMRKHLESIQKRPGFIKIQQCCMRARKDSLEWAWVDSCCIDKRSSGELSEAINSMFKWYERADICYVYLEDVPPHDDAVRMEILSTSRWFTRGWTLQELIAARKVRFYANDWSLLGTKSQEDHDFTNLISHITGIDAASLLHRAMLRRISIAMRMSWAAKRETTREEDRAYSLMGIFDVNMPILYGEGLQKAFERLQIEIMKKSPDQSIFAWRLDKNDYNDLFEGVGLLATSPSYFKNSRFTIEGLYTRVRPFAITNIGIKITLRMNLSRGSNPDTDWEDNVLWVATLRCLDLPDEMGNQRRIQLFLRERRQIILGSGIRVFERVFPYTLAMVNHETTKSGNILEIYVPSPDQIVHLEQAGCVHILEETF
jgi:Heterokaryon incompatibility protein (HET)